MLSGHSVGAEWAQWTQRTHRKQKTQKTQKTHRTRSKHTGHRRHVVNTLDTEDTENTEDSMGRVQDKIVGITIKAFLSIFLDNVYYRHFSNKVVFKGAPQ